MMADNPIPPAVLALMAQGISLHKALAMQGLSDPKNGGKK